MITVNTKKTFTLIAALLMTVVAFGAVIAASESDAAGIDQSGIKASGFKQDRDGTLTIPVTGIVDGDATIVISENGNTIKEQTQTVTADTASLAVTFRLSPGTHQLSIALTNGGSTVSGHYDVNVSENVWSKMSTYVAIVVVAIVVIIIAVVYMRANPRNKPTTTFTELEQEKAAKASETQAAPSKTEKKKYGGSEESSGKMKYTSSRRK